MWICSRNPIGVHRYYDPLCPNDDDRAAFVTVPLDGFAACTCDAYIENRAALKSRANELQASCRHIAQAFANRCGFRHESPLAKCALCGSKMLRIEDVIPGWVGNDRNSLLNDLLTIRKELHAPDC